MRLHSTIDSIKGEKMDFDIIFKIAAVGVLTAVITQVLKNIYKEDVATIASLAGIIIVLLMVVKLISELFETVKTLFMLY